MLLMHAPIYIPVYGQSLLYNNLKVLATSITSPDSTHTHTVGACQLQYSLHSTDSETSQILTSSQIMTSFKLRRKWSRHIIMIQKLRDGGIKKTLAKVYMCVTTFITTEFVPMLQGLCWEQSIFIHCSRPTNSNRLPHGMGLHCPLPMTPVGEEYMVFSIKRNLQGPESLSINGSVSMKFQKQFIWIKAGTLTPESYGILPAHITEPSTTWWGCRNTYISKTLLKIRMNKSLVT